MTRLATSKEPTSKQKGKSNAKIDGIKPRRRLVSDGLRSQSRRPGKPVVWEGVCRSDCSRPSLWPTAGRISRPLPLMRNNQPATLINHPRRRRHRRGCEPRTGGFVLVLAMFWKGRAPCQEADLISMGMNGNCPESFHYMNLIYVRQSGHR